MAYITTDRTGVPISSSAPAVIGPSGGYTSGGSSSSGSVSSNEKNVASDVYNYVTTNDDAFTSGVRDLFDYSSQNSAFNAAEAAKARSWSAEQNKLAMAVSAEEAQKNRDWQEMMSNTSHQRAVKDLIAAGLNPVLASMNGASTPSGSAGSGYTSGGSSASADNSGSSAAQLFGAAINNAAQLHMQERNLEFAKEQLDASIAMNKLNADVGLMQSENSLAGSRALAGATMYASDNALEGSKYGSNKNYESNIYSSDNALKGKVYEANLNSANTKYRTDKEFESAIKKMDNDRTVAEIQNEKSIIGSAWKLGKLSLKKGFDVDINNPDTWPASYF